MKKILYLFIALILIVLSSCGKSETNVNTLRYQDVSILESREKGGAIDIFIRAKDTAADIYLIVIAHNAKEPTNEQIIAGVDYDGVKIVAYESGKGTIYKTITNLEEEVLYDAYVTLSLDGKYAQEIYKSTVTTYSDANIILGDGTVENPYQIRTVSDLEKVGSTTEFLNASFILMNDLDLSQKYGEGKESFVPLGFQTGSLKAFNGTFNGNGHIINGLYIDSKTESTGLFAQVGATGTVTNLILTNVNVKSNSQRLGACVGYNKGVVSNIVVDGGIVESLTTTSATAKVGGAIGDMYDSGTVSKIYTNVTVISGGANAGGVIGSIDAAATTQEDIVIGNCYSVGDVISGGKYAGGIVGYFRCAKLSNCYATGDVTGAYGVGGVVGFAQHRKDSTIQPSVKRAFYMGEKITATDLSNSNSSGKVIGNLSTSNGGVDWELLYCLESTVVTAGKLSTAGTTTDASSFANKEFLTSIGLNFAYDWDLKDGAIRPTLKFASNYDMGR